MTSICTVLAVADIAAARKFYEELFGLEVWQDYGINVSFTCGLALQQAFGWLVGLPEERIAKRPNNMEICFEESDFDGFLKETGKISRHRPAGHGHRTGLGTARRPLLRPGRTYHRSRRRDENGHRTFPRHGHDTGRSLRQNGCFRRRLDETAERLNPHIK